MTWYWPSRWTQNCKSSKTRKNSNYWSNNSHMCSGRNAKTVCTWRRPFRYNSFLISQVLLLLLRLSLPLVIIQMYRTMIDNLFMVVVVEWPYVSLQLFFTPVWERHWLGHVHATERSGNAWVRCNYWGGCRWYGRQETVSKQFCQRLGCMLSVSSALLVYIFLFRFSLACFAFCFWHAPFICHGDDWTGL